MKVNHEEYYNNVQKQLVEMRKTNKENCERLIAQMSEPCEKDGKTP